MKKFLYTIILVTLLSACTHEELIGPPEPINSDPVNSTIIMFYPWSSNLKSYFDQNIKDFSSTIASHGLDDQRVIVCIETEPTDFKVIELKYKKGTCINDTITAYTIEDITSEAGLSELFKSVKDISPSSQYSMIIGSHGMGWIPKTQTSQKSRYKDTLHYEVEGEPLTRYFGGLSSIYQIDITTFAQSLSDADLELQYLLFDDCYMSSVEVAYDLKDVTHYLIACPTEVMAYGFPYHTCGQYLLGNADYANICYAFYQFYSEYYYPYGTIAVTDCSEIDNLANIVREINLSDDIVDVDMESVQTMDGYSPTIFYDFADYMERKCSDEVLLQKFIEQMDKTVPYKTHTQQYFTAKRGAMDIDSFGGLTTSENSSNQRTESYTETGWYLATH